MAKLNSIATLARAVAAVALLGATSTHAQTKNKWGEVEEINPGEFGAFFGADGWNCRHWLSSASAEKEGSSWILGWWSGVNQSNENDHFVGGTLDAPQLLARIKKLCRSDLDMAISNAAAKTYYELGHPGRKSKQ